MRTSALSAAYARPALRHVASSSNALDADHTRPRSGSASSVSSAFANSAFSNAWLANPGQATSAGRSPLGRTNHEEYSFAEASSDDHLNFSTLDYLGLADTSLDSPASVSELRNQARRAIDAHGPASRLRASTVSNVNRPFRPSVTSVFDQDPDTLLAQALDQVSIYDSLMPVGVYPQSAALLHRDVVASNRPRATTIGTLENPMRGAQNRGFLASIPQSPVQGSTYSQGFDSARFGYPARSRSDRDLTRSREGSRDLRSSRLSISSGTSRTGTPDNAGSSTPQMPTRSLWIGNLDVSATSEALLGVFSPYGAIESLRMLPEKTCAFVNFVDKADAVRARDDVLNRLGGQVPELSETAPVRIGFGKIDSAPAGPTTSTVAPAPPGLVFTNGSISITQPPAGAASAAAAVDANAPADQSTLPTRALWIGSIPNTTSSATLLQIFSPFGPVESARVLTHKSCGFVNFERLDSAISARNALNGRDILGSDVGPIRIGFARVPTKSPVIGGPENEQVPKLGEGLNTVRGATGVSTETQLSVEGGGVENYRSQLVLDLVKQGIHEQVLERGLAQDGAVSEQQMIMQVLSGARREEEADVRAAAEVRPPVTYYTTVPIIGDRQNMRRFDVARLREIRKRLDSGGATQEEVDSITRDLLDDCADLASDYIGNTIIQKLFERADPALRHAMLERIAPHLAMIGIHKNGTWAAQKIIECSTTDEERALIALNLRPFAPPLMCDSLGNYVCAGTLRFTPPYSDYVYDAMIDRMWDIAQNRFGARCMRTCLESPHTSLYQKKRIATSVILNSIPLATNPNGALLLTWLVEQSNLPGRYGLLANRFAPHVAHLCTHKLASLTVLRIINQTSEPTAATTLLTTIFHSPSDQTLTEILSDASNGSQVIGKLLAVQSIPKDDKPALLDAVRRVLPNIKAASTPPYRRLLEEVGLPIPAGGSHSYTRAQPTSAAQWQQSFQMPAYGQMPNPGFPQPLGVAGTGMAPLLIPQGGAMGMREAGAAGVVGGQTRAQTLARGRMSPIGMLSPGSDPFNPFASPSIDLPFFQQSSIPLAAAAAQSNLGGLGIMNPAQGYYQQNGQPGMYAQTGFQ
jgi:protein JSN1